MERGGGKIKQSRPLVCELTVYFYQLPTLFNKDLYLHFNFMKR